MVRFMNSVQFDRQMKNIREMLNKPIRSDDMELLTTGQMIDKLKVGGTAELSVKHQIPKEHGKSYKKVTKAADGDIVWMSDTGVVDLGKPFILYGHTVNWKWRILPNYVSFETAMKALKDGEYVYYHPSNNESISIHIQSGFKGWMSKYSWEELLNGNWTIKE